MLRNAFEQLSCASDERTKELFASIGSVCRSQLDGVVGDRLVLSHDLCGCVHAVQQRHQAVWWLQRSQCAELGRHQEERKQQQRVASSGRIVVRGREAPYRGGKLSCVERPEIWTRCAQSDSDASANIHKEIADREEGYDRNQWVRTNRETRAPYLVAERRRRGCCDQ